MSYRAGDQRRRGTVWGNIRMLSHTNRGSGVRGDGSMGNRSGKTYALTVLTPMRPLRTWGLRAVFLAVRLGFFKLVQRNLKELQFIHFARWVIVPRSKFPRVDPSQPRESLKYDYLLFCSNFNGDWAAYIDAFSEVVPFGMDNVWRWSVKYPMSVPITPFLAYIRQNQFDADYYYSAYPNTTTNDVLNALALRARLETFARASRDLDPDAFKREYEQFVLSVSRALGSTGPRRTADTVARPEASIAKGALTGINV